MALGALTQVSQAALLYTCAPGPGDAKCNGNEYAVFVASHAGDVYTLQLDIRITGDYTGNQWSDNIVAVAIKGLPTFSAPSLVGTPGGNWTLSANELNANGCNGGASGGMCAEANSFADGANVVGPGTVLSWQFQFTSTATSIESVHLKYLYAEGGTAANYHKADGTDLGSYDIPVQDGPQGDDPVPEPSTYALVGAAAVALGLWKRKTA